MHELSLAEGIVTLIEEQARKDGFTRVRKVHVLVGALSHVMPEALAFGFTSASKGTLAEGAELVLTRPPGTATCMGCGQSVTLGQRGDPCPECGSFQLLVTGGEELRVTDLDVE
ncbi:MAG: hydrogenase maturation nickel metallochaperone HypA [Myxococcota bacterium]